MEEAPARAQWLPIWGNLTSRTYAGTTATLTYDVLDHLVAWNAGSTNQEWYAYDASGNRVLRRSTTGTSITTYDFGLEEHLYGATGINTGNTYYYCDTILTHYPIIFSCTFLDHYSNPVHLMLPHCVDT